MEVSLNPFDRDDELWSWYKKAEASFWTVEEVDLETDRKDWLRLTDNERFFIKQVLAFFASADIVVADNAFDNFWQEVPEREAKFFYGFQVAIENIHSEMYSELITTYVKDKSEALDMLTIATRESSVRNKVVWMQKWCDPHERTFVERLLAFACVEGIFFSASFCAIFWLRKRGLMPGLCFSNELIARDEGMHRDFACLLYRRRGGVQATLAHSIIREAVEAELAFVHESLPVALIGMNETSMQEYVRFVADHLCQTLGHPTLYGATNPFDWMDLISLQGKTNFFEKRVSEYKKSCVGDARDVRTRCFTTDAEF